MARPRFEPFRNRVPALAYVAFVDILGFSQEVRANFETVLKVYEAVLDNTPILQAIQGEVSLRIFSDAFIVTATKLWPLVGVVNALNMQTLINDCMIRGGIGFGQHIEAADAGNLYVVSQALVQAVEVEKSVGKPCVALHQDIMLPREVWNPYANPFQRGVLFFDGIRLVNPFNVMWGQSAMTRVSPLRDKYPAHRDKHDWFLRLYEAVKSGDPLLPPEILATE